MLKMKQRGDTKNPQLLLRVELEIVVKMKVKRGAVLKIT